MKKILASLLLITSSMASTFEYEVRVGRNGTLSTEASFDLETNKRTHKILTDYIYSKSFLSQFDGRLDAITFKKVESNHIIPKSRLIEGFDETIRVETRAVYKNVYPITVVLNCDVKIEKDFFDLKCRDNKNRYQRLDTDTLFNHFSINLSCSSDQGQMNCNYFNSAQAKDVVKFFIKVLDQDSAALRGANKNIVELYRSYVAFKDNIMKKSDVLNALNRDQFYKKDLSKLRGRLMNYLTPGEQLKSSPIVISGTSDAI
ncbi:MAG: hypothetical protein VX341_12590 [Bdellovibrionota bacterium]|nr:hypothetical protein [Bdellovibrionota bacterium]